MGCLTEVLNAAPAVTNVVAYGTIIIKKWLLRRVIVLGQRIEAQGCAGIGAEEIITSALTDLSALQPAKATAEGVLYASDLAADLAPINWLCAGLKLTPGSPTIVSGNSFGGKSLALQDS